MTTGAATAIFYPETTEFAQALHAIAISITFIYYVRTLSMM